MEKKYNEEAAHIIHTCHKNHKRTTSMRHFKCGIHDKWRIDLKFVRFVTNESESLEYKYSLN